MNNNERIALCNAALESVKPLIPSSLFQDAYDNINKYNEWGLGIETLMDQISELGIKVSKQDFEKIKAAMVSMGLGDSDRLKYLWENDVSS